MNPRPLLVVLFWGWSVVSGVCDARFVYNEDYRPLSFREGGTMTGVLIDLVKTGEADAFVTIATPARAVYALASSHPASTTWLPTTAAILEFLRTNRADLLIESELTIEYNAQLSKKSVFADQLPRWDGFLREMIKDGTVRRVLAKYGHGLVSHETR